MQGMFWVFNLCLFGREKLITPHQNTCPATALPATLNVKCMWYVRYVWETLDVGYIQGMCDLLAPLLVVFDDGM